MIARCQEPCFEVACDNCGEGDNEDYGNSFHHPDEACAIESCEVRDWMIIRNGQGEIKALYCETCWEEMDERQRTEALA